MEASQHPATESPKTSEEGKNNDGTVFDMDDGDAGRFTVGAEEKHDISGIGDTLDNKDSNIPASTSDAPPPYSSPPPPPAGNRIVLFSPMSNLTSRSDLGPPPCLDLNGDPTFFASAYIFGGLQPCKVGPHLRNAHVPYNRREYMHQGRVDLLPYVPELMELVTVSDGQFPTERRLVEGGYESDGKKLYHAVATVGGVRVPGKTGEHLSGANVGFGGKEHVVQDYEILCWRS